MSKFRRLFTILGALISIALALLMILSPEAGLRIAAIILSLSLTLSGIGKLVYYFTMARHMVGGRYSLYVGLIYLDLGSFTSIIIDSSRIFIILYLVGIYAFGAAIDLLRGREAKRNGDPGWRSKIALGIGNLLAALLCLIFIRSGEVTVFFYAAGVVYAAILRIREAFKKTAIVYIP